MISELVNRHPCKERIVKLLGGVFDQNISNCFGTALYLVGVNKKPAFVPQKEMEDFLKDCKKIRVPSPSHITLVCSQMYPTSYPTHTSLYLGREGNTRVIVDQPGTSFPYRIKQGIQWCDWLLGPHFYRVNT
jgi:hypothetical protein